MGKLYEVKNRCSVCGDITEKEYTTGLFMGQTVTCICSCEIRKREEEEKRREAEEKERRIKKLRVDSLMDETQRQVTFATDKGFHPKQTEYAKNYVKNFEDFKKRNRWLLFWGDVATGKTHTSLCIANALIDQGVSVMITRFSDIIAGAGSQVSEGYADYFTRFD